MCFRRSILLPVGLVEHKPMHVQNQLSRCDCEGYQAITQREECLIGLTICIALRWAIEHFTLLTLGLRYLRLCSGNLCWFFANLLLMRSRDTLAIISSTPYPQWSVNQMKMTAIPCSENSTGSLQPPCKGLMYDKTLWTFVTLVMLSGLFSYVDGTVSVPDGVGDAI